MEAQALSGVKDGSRGRAKEAEPFRDSDLSEFLEVAVELELVTGLPQDPQEPAVRRVSIAPAFLEEFIVEAFYFFPNRLKEEGVAGVPCLDDDRSRFAPSPCSSRHLGDPLEEAFTRTEIGVAKMPVRIQDPDTAYMLKIEPLGNHLGTHEDPLLSRSKGLKNLLKPAVAG
jgi:hypothetical protein